MNDALPRRAMASCHVSVCDAPLTEWSAYSKWTSTVSDGSILYTEKPAGKSGSA